MPKIMNRPSNRPDVAAIFPSEIQRRYAESLPALQAIDDGRQEFRSVAHELITTCEQARRFQNEMKTHKVDPYERQRREDREAAEEAAVAWSALARACSRRVLLLARLP